MTTKQDAIKLALEALKMCQNFYGCSSQKYNSEKVTEAIKALSAISEQPVQDGDALRTVAQMILDKLDHPTASVTAIDAGKLRKAIAQSAQPSDKTACKQCMGMKVIAPAFNQLVPCPSCAAPSQEVAPAQAMPEDVHKFLVELSKQTPEKPDYWSSCGQCQSNSNAAEELLDSQPKQEQSGTDTQARDDELPLLTASSECPICGVDTPHSHSGNEIVQHKLMREPVAFQWRTKPRLNKAAEWSQWSEITKDLYLQLLGRRTYERYCIETRALYTAPLPTALQAIYDAYQAELDGKR